MVIPNLKFSEMGGGYSGVNFGHPKSKVFRNGGVFRSKLWSGKFGPKFTVRPETCLCITVVSHILRMWRLMRTVLSCGQCPTEWLMEIFTLNFPMSAWLKLCEVCTIIIHDYSSTNHFADSISPALNPTIAVIIFFVSLNWNI